MRGNRVNEKCNAGLVDYTATTKPQMDKKISFLTDYLLIILKALVLSILKTLIQCHIQGQLLSNYLFYPLDPLLFSFPLFKT